MKKSNLFILLALILTSCSQPFWQKDGQPKIRIVDLQGKSRPVVTRVPELNAQALASQGKVIPTENRPVQQGEIKYQQPAIKNYQDQNIANAEATNTFPTNQPTAPKEILGASAKEPTETVEYDLAEAKEEKKHVAKTAKVTTKASSGSKFFAQVGSFSNRGSADSLLKKMQKFHAGKIEIVEGDRTIYRVLLGPFSEKNKAKALVKKITDSGQDAILTKGK